MIFLSLVIPAHNAEAFIERLLQSLIHSRNVDLAEVELLLVDDASSDDTAVTVQQFFEEGKNQVFSDVKILSLSANSGPAKARNVGVRYAVGEVVAFLDADVIVRTDTIAQLLHSFRTDPDLFALTGVWDKRQHSTDFFPRFKALRDWSYWINERDPRNYYYLFSTRIAAINRQLFLRLGGFDERYTAALVEDIDLTYRIARRYAVVFNPKVMVHHEFEQFRIVARKYFLRSYYWSKMYRERKKFDPVATTWKEAVTTMSAGLFLMALLLSFLSYLGNLGSIAVWLWIACGVVGLIHLWGVRKFLWFCYQEEGFWFAMRAFFVGVALYLVILAGAVSSWIW